MTSVCDDLYHTCSMQMPRAAAVASHEVCYISRHWLHLLKHFTHPGPISQHEFACRHGGTRIQPVLPPSILPPLPHTGVLPAVALEEARSLTLPLRPEVWESLQQQYGGGPLVPQLDHCSSCQEHLKRLAERRKLEKETVQKVHTCYSACVLCVCRWWGGVWVYYWF